MICQNAKRCTKARHNKCKNNCNIIKCEDIATHGLLTDKIKIYCRTCITQLSNSNIIQKDDYHPMSKHCATLTCNNTNPKYGIRGISPPSHCSECSKGTEMVNVSSKLCEIQEENKFICNSQATKNKVGDKSYCALHAKIISELNGTEIISTSSKCIVCKNVEPTFILDSNDTSMKPTHCKKCAEATKEPYHDVKHNKFCEVCKTERPTFGLTKGNPTHCSNHKTDKMFDVCNKMCEVCEQKDPPIRTRASFKDDNGKLKYCYHCDPKLPEKLEAQAKLVKPKKGCCVKGCTVLYPSFGLLWKQPTHCKQHKKDLIDVVSVKCFDLTCKKFRSFGLEWRKPTHCAEHGKLLNMENVLSKRCKECKIFASYGSKWQKPTHCMKHGIPLDLQNVVSKKCNAPNCKVRPIFGFPGKSMEYCISHIQPGMEDLSHIKCFEEGCNKRACFGTELNVPEYCVDHKFPNMEDVVHTKCMNENCSTRPSFGYEIGKATHCVNHKNDDMFDVVSKMCEADNCCTQAVYNYTGLMAKFCSTHKLDQMINVKATECEESGCCIQASFNYKNESAKFCFTHKEPIMINVRSSYCLIDGCDTQANFKKYKGYCFNCFYENYPDEPIIRNYKTKEIAIMNSISDNISVNIIKDKLVHGGSSKYRPDGLIKLDTHNIIIEIDEKQHKGVGYLNEELRISEIYNDLKQVPLVVIRFNPDRFNQKKNGLFLKSNITGLVEIEHPERFNNAINELIQTIENAILNPPNISISTIKLRFDTQ